MGGVSKNKTTAYTEGQNFSNKMFTFRCPNEAFTYVFLLNYSKCIIITSNRNMVTS